MLPKLVLATFAALTVVAPLALAGPPKPPVTNGGIQGRNPVNQVRPKKTEKFIVRVKNTDGKWFTAGEHDRRQDAEKQAQQWRDRGYKAIVTIYG